MTKIAYGIDFGTTNSTIAVVDRQRTPHTLKIDPQAENPSVMRSVIYVSPEMRFLYGKPAVDAYLIDVAQSKGAIKKKIFTGRYVPIAGDKKNGMAEEYIEFEEDSGGRLFQALKSALSSNLLSTINIFGNPIPLEAVVGGFLKEMKTRADEIVGENVTTAIVGRPVEYAGDNNDLAVSRMESALKYAGFNHIEFEYEPVGAAYDYGIDITADQTVLVFDFGGGTIDLSLVRFPQKEFLTNTGLAIGGDYFNSELFREKIAPYFGSETMYGMAQMPLPSYIFRALENWYTISILKREDFRNALESFRYMSSNLESIDALRSLVENNLGFGIYEEVERVKKQLSDLETEAFVFEADKIHINEEIRRDTFEKIIKEDLQRIDDLIATSLISAGMSPESVDVVATTGGSSLIPIVRNLLEEKFGREKIMESDAFTSVASGLALRAKEVFYRKVTN